MAAVGRTYRFLLNVEFPPTPLLNSESNNTLFNHLREVSTDSVVSLSILQVLIEEHRNSHRERHNENCVQCSLKVGDFVKAHVQV